MSGIGDKRARNEETREGGFSYKGSCRYKGLSLLPSCLVLSKGLSLPCPRRMKQHERKMEWVKGEK